MRTKKISTKPKKFNNVRVTDPTSLHSVVLYPRQGLSLVLSSGDFFVKSNSSMLLYEGNETDSKGRHVHTFSQKYDLDKCDLPKGKDSSVALGSICVIKKTSENKVIESNVVVSVLRHEGVTVSCLNPDEEYVQIFPHSLLRITIAEPDMSYSDSWKFSVHGENGINLISKGQGMTQIPNVWNPVINPYLDNDSKDLIGKINPINFVHYCEFILDKESVKKTTSMVSDKINVGKIVLRNANKYRIVNLVLNNTAKDRKTFKESPAFISVPSSPLTREEIKVGNMNILINPAEHEYVEFNKLANSISIQMAPAHLIFPEIPEGTKWTCSSEKLSQKISVTPGSDVNRWGHPFQTFIVELNRAALVESSSSGFVGHVFIGLDADNSQTLCHRRISFWLPPNTVQSCGRYAPGDFCGGGYVPRKGKVTEELKLKVATDLKFVLIDSFPLFKGIQTHSFNTVPPPPPPPYVVQPNKTYSVLSEKKSIGSGTMYYDPKDGTEINLPASSKITIRMPFEEKGAGLSCWAVRIKEDRLIKVSDIKTSVNGNSSGYLEVEIEACLLGDLNTTVLGGSILFTNGTDNRLIKIRIIPANAVVHVEVPFKMGEKANKVERNKFSLIKSFNHRDSVVLSSAETLFIKTPKFSDGFDLAVDLVQKSLPHSANITPALKKKIDDSCVWYPTNHVTITNTSVVLKKIESINPAWEDILKSLKGQKEPVHIADLIFTGRSVNDVSVHTAFGEIQQNTKVSKVLHLLLKVAEETGSSKQISVFNPADKTEIPVEPDDEVFVTLKKNVSAEGMGEWPWFLSKHTNGASFLNLEKKAGDFIWKFKVRQKPEDSDRTTVTFSVCDGREKKDVSVQLVFKLK